MYLNKILQKLLPMYQPINNASDLAIQYQKMKIVSPLNQSLKQQFGDNFHSIHSTQIFIHLQTGRQKKRFKLSLVNQFEI
jgi:hypothetical protein